MTYTGPSIVDYLASIGQPSDIATRKALAEKYGIQNYVGTGGQNTQLLGALRGAGGTAPTASNPAGPRQDANGNVYKIPDGKGGTYSGPASGSPVPIGAAGSSASAGVTINPTGDKGLDAILGSIKGIADNLITTGYTIPETLKITPDLISNFLAYAHQAVDPYTKQQIDSRLSDVNANLANLGTKYGNDMGQLLQDFGTNLATEQNNAGANGTAFSGLRALGETNMAASTNRSLSSLASDYGNSIGSAARSAAADVGAANAPGIVLPTLSTGTVSLAGGSRGSSSLGAGLNYGYNPSIYTVGNIPSQGTKNVNDQEQSYLSQYGTLAGANSNGSRSVNDLIGMMSGLPSGYKLPTNLM